MTVTLKLNADTVRVGDAAKGTVSGGPPGATVTVELLWRTEGDCETDERIVAAAEVTAAPDTEVPFELPVPAAGPMSYVGKTFTISWCVRADTTPPAEIPLAVHAVLRQNPAE